MADGIRLNEGDNTPSQGTTSVQDAATPNDAGPSSGSGVSPPSNYNANPQSNDAEEGMLELQQAPSTLTTPAVHSVFTPSQRRYLVASISLAAFFSPLSANIYLPALNTLARELGVSISMMNLTVTSYMVFQGVAPMFMGDLADTAGRRPAVLLCFIIYIAANIGLASQSNYVVLLVLRCVQATGSSPTIALAAGVVADIATSAQRGTYMGWVSAGALLGPAIGPVAGGLLAQFLGWRAIFWFLVIFGAAFLVQFAVLFPETGRNIVGNGSYPPQKWNISVITYLKTRKTTRKTTDDATNTTPDTAREEGGGGAEAPKKPSFASQTPSNLSPSSAKRTHASSS
ncbi:hypothetical protein ACJ72_06248 [Emergomyces africanus]|uniref:Major facilitator superfamily (MFS) profile domain-containing protein n=1 Tax=Emergomyces africanus TaxID=1955775 RepID=A0A1B7NRL6_9EURO|nr:hypothetical protein ACJ72_06248 [Emergomyces africanus]